MGHCVCKYCNTVISVSGPKVLISFKILKSLSEGCRIAQAGYELDTAKKKSFHSGGHLFELSLLLDIANSTSSQRKGAFFDNAVKTD